MKNLLNPKWLIVLNTIPIVILFCLYFNEFQVIKTLLEDTNIELWLNFGYVLLLLALVTLGYSISCIFLKKRLSEYYAFSSLIIYSGFLYTYSVYSNDIIPWNIPRWMLSSESFLYPGTFLMPTLAHALFIAILRLTHETREHKAWKNLLAAICVPLLTYIFFQIILPLWQPVDYMFEQHIIIIAYVIGVILFLFFTIRAIYILHLKKGKNRKKIYLIFKLIIGIILPLIGLYVNKNMNGIFGDFNSFWFYALAIINGILINIPHPKKINYKLLLYIAQCVTFSYIFYFFIVFLPYLPLSVIAIIALGSGFLMLTPLILFVIHVQELNKGFKQLKVHYKKHILLTIGSIAFLIIPVLITAKYKYHKTVLNETLDFIYAPNYEKEYSINKNTLEYTLNTIKTTKSRQSGFFLNSQTPYLSSFFKWLVLDNLTLSNAKINTIEKLFFNETSSFNLTSEELRNKDVEISNISSKSTYNNEENYWTSWIDIEITNANSTNFTSEYATTIDLPNGCWINDYYLYVGNKKEKGILAEKKSAMWIFSEIRNINRDPGLLHYLTGNKVAFRVFPFAKKEVRKTGIQFIHKDQVSIQIDDHKMILGDTVNTPSTVFKNDHIIYVSSKEKENLQTIKRTPYYHFILDISKEKNIIKDSYVTAINNFMTQQTLSSKNAKISFTNTYTKTTAFNTNWQESLDEQNFEGGFYLERAIKKILFNSYSNPSNSYPIIIVVTDNILDAIIEKNFADFKIAYPENNTFYHLNTLGYLASHSLDTSPKTHIKDDVKIDLDNAVLAYPNLNNPIAYIANDNASSLVLKTPLFKLNTEYLKTSKWETGLLIHGKSLTDLFYPEKAQKTWLASIKNSFKSGIMTPLTSFIVVENEAQKATLKRKQEDVLSGKKSLDLNEQSQRMSEPSILILVIILISIWLLKHKKQMLLNTKRKQTGNLE